MNRKSSGLWAIVVKLGSKFLAILAKGTKFWLATTSFAAYSYLYGWKFAVAIMAMLFFHESGHVWAMRKCGIPTKGFYFIPLLGGAAVPDRAFKSRGEEFYVAIMGPIWGWLFSLAIMLIYYATGNPLFAVISSWMALINLFNLLPVSPLDGGRMLKSILFSINSKLAIFAMYCGVLLCALFIFYFKIFFFALLLVLSGIELYFENRRNKRLIENKALMMSANAELTKEMVETEEIIQAEQIEHMPKMKKSHVIIAIIGSILIATVLFIVMYVMKDVPGADAAHKMLRN